MSTLYSLATKFAGTYLGQFGQQVTDGAKRAANTALTAAETLIAQNGPTSRPELDSSTKAGKRITSLRAELARSRPVCDPVLVKLFLGIVGLKDAVIRAGQNESSEETSSKIKMLIDMDTGLITTQYRGGEQTLMRTLTSLTETSMNGITRNGIPRQRDKLVILPEHLELCKIYDSIMENADKEVIDAQANQGLEALKTTYHDPSAPQKDPIIISLENSQGILDGRFSLMKERAPTPPPPAAASTTSRDSSQERKWDHLINAEIPGSKMSRIQYIKERLLKLWEKDEFTIMATKIKIFNRQIARYLPDDPYLATFLPKDSSTQPSQVEEDSSAARPSDAAPFEVVNPEIRDFPTLARIRQRIDQFEEYYRTFFESFTELKAAIAQMDEKIVRQAIAHESETVGGTVTHEELMDEVDPPEDSEPPSQSPATQILVAAINTSRTTPPPQTVLDTEANLQVAAAADAPLVVRPSAPEPAAAAPVATLNPLPPEKSRKKKKDRQDPVDS